MAKIKVLMFGWELPPWNSGGLGTACEGLLNGLSGQDVSVSFVLPREMPIEKSAVPARVIFADAFGATRRPLSAPLHAYATDESARRSGWGLFEEVLRYAEAASAIAAQESFDIIHAHDWLSFGAGLAAKRASGKPLIVHMHATEFDRTGGNGLNEAVYRIERDAMREADSVIAVSEYTKSLIVREYGLPADKIVVVHNGVAPAAPKGAAGATPSFDAGALKRSGAKIVLFLGRITLQKGPDYFLRAAEKVLVRDRSVYFILAGSGDMERRMVEEAARMGISDRVVFAGFVRGRERDALYAAADLYVMPSVSEPFGITPLEGMAVGTPVLISKQSGVSEAVRHALKVDFWDTDEMANKILSVVQNPALGNTLSKNGRDEVKKMNWEVAAEKVYDAYKKALDYIAEISI